MTTRPFRTSHHTSFNVGLIGSGRVSMLGEVLLAHHY
jgi:predicted ATPase with chaperone activity